jgi:hypothetical protein
MVGATQFPGREAARLARLLRPGPAYIANVAIGHGRLAIGHWPLPIDHWRSPIADVTSPMANRNMAHEPALFVSERFDRVEP